MGPSTRELRAGQARIASSVVEALGADALAPFLRRHTYQSTVHVEDTDFTGAMYHGRFLCHCGRARAEFLGPQVVRDVRDALGVGFVVHGAQLRFMRPARFGDRLAITTELSIPSCHKLDFLHSVHRSDEAEVLAEVSVRVVCVDTRGMPVRIPFERIVGSARSGVEQVWDQNKDANPP
jgi:acyl-CoA thioester hydrolase